MYLRIEIPGNVGSDSRGSRDHKRLPVDPNLVLDTDSQTAIESNIFGYFKSKLILDITVSGNSNIWAINGTV